MRSRANTTPVLAALGAAAVVTLGAVGTPAPAFAADPSPTAGEDPAPDPSGGPPGGPPHASPPAAPGPPGSTPPYRPVPSLTVRLSFSAARAAPGGSVTVTARVGAQRAVAHHAVLRVSAPGDSVVGGAVSLGDVSAARSALSVVNIPAGHAAGTVTVTASLSADRASTRSDTRTITVTGRSTPPAAGASGGGAVPPPPPSLPGVTGAATADEAGGPADARLPLIAGRDPAVAPGRLPAVRPVSLRTRAAPLGLDAASYRLLWTQVAWLTALLVGVSLLLVQLRLNRRRLAGRR